MPAPILEFFAYEHLPVKLQKISQPIGDLARALDAELPDGAEKSAGLRKLLEAKDCFVRARLAAAPCKDVVPPLSTPPLEQPIRRA